MIFYIIKDDIYIWKLFKTYVSFHFLKNMCVKRTMLNKFNYMFSNIVKHPYQKVSDLVTMLSCHSFRLHSNFLWLFSQGHKENEKVSQL